MSYQNREPQFFAPNANHAAIAAAGLAGLTLVLAFSPSGVFAPTGVSFLALVAGIIGLRKAQGAPRAGDTAMSIAGIVVGGLGFLAGLLVSFVYFV